MAELVLVHGLWYGPAAMSLLARRLRGAGHVCHRFGYPSLHRSLARNARELQQFVRQRACDQVHLIGHSLGGLVILSMLDEYKDLPPGRVVLLGTPVRGSSVARQMASTRPLRGLVGEARQALETGFEHAPAGRQTGVIAGTLGIGLGLFVKGLRRPHDGTVQCAETMLEGATARLELPVSHTGLVFSRAVAIAIDRFVREGRFS